MKVRRVITFTMLVSFIFLSLSGIMLFFSPQGRGAYWNDWRILGRSKVQFTAVHTTFMVLFLVGGIWHIVLNWKPITNYLKDRTKKVRFSTPEFSVALVLCCVFFIGALVGFFPFKQFLDFGEGVKSYWERTSGSPPWPHAELARLDRFCRGMEDYERLEHQRLVSIDCGEALAALRAAGMEVEDESQQLIEIANANSTTPQALAEIVVAVAKPRAPSIDEATAVENQDPFAMPYSGLGRMTLREYADKYNADLDLALSILCGKGIDLDPDKMLRGEASRFNTNPEGIIQLLNEAAREMGS
jgi:hypothetical protein